MEVLKSHGYGGKREKILIIAEYGVEDGILHST